MKICFNKQQNFFSALCAVFPLRSLRLKTQTAKNAKFFAKNTKDIQYQYKFVQFLFVLFFTSGSIHAQHTIAYCSKVIVQDSMEISLYSPTMFRFRISHLKGEKFPAKYEIPFLIGKTDNWQKISFTKKEDASYYYITTDSLQIRIAKRGLQWTISNKKTAKQVCPSYGPVYGMFKDGYTVFDNVSAFDAPSKISRYSHWFYNPSTKNYTDTYLEEDLIEDKYFIYGPSYSSLFQQMNELIGPEPLLPKKGYGFFQTQHLSCQGSQEQLMEAAEKFRERNIPLDNLILDFEWGDGCDGDKELTWGSSLNWNKNYSQPLTPQQMIQKLDSMHIDVMLIHHSAGNFKNRKHQGWTETSYDEQTWWDAYKTSLDMGIRGTWQDTRINDITDSYIYNRTQQYYGDNKRVLFLGCRKVMAFNPWDFRFSTMPTENMIGARRYPFHWTEDCSSSWNEMAFQLKAINNTSGPMSGYSYLASDVIGATWKIQARWNQFTALSAVARSHNSKPWSGNIDINDFTNKIRITGRDTVKIAKQAEAEQTETAEESIRKYLQLRYRLLPYIYSYAFVNYLTGMPVTRPMLLAFPDDYICSSDTWPYQYMLGENMLIAPVYGDFNTMEIYLPRGYDWIDYETKEIYKGGGFITYNTSDINKLPIFIKSGAIIPMRQQTNWIDTKITDTITFDIYPSDTVSSFTMYEDDGETMAYQKGIYAKTKISCQQKNNETEITVDATDGSYASMPTKRLYNFQVNNINAAPSDVSINGQTLVKNNDDATKGWSYNAAKHLLMIKTDKDVRQALDIIVKNIIQ